MWSSYEVQAQGARVDGTVLEVASAKGGSEYHLRIGVNSLPSGKVIAAQYGRHERWGRLVKRMGAAGELANPA